MICPGYALVRITYLVFDMPSLERSTLDLFPIGLAALYLLPLASQLHASASRKENVALGVGKHI